MTISTKYSPGDEVWFMDFTGPRRDVPKQPCCSTVEVVKITGTAARMIVEYYACGWRGESSLFSSKAALLASL